MFLYFLSPVPCALKLNGNFTGFVTENYSIMPFAEGFYEMLPLSARRFPLRFELTKPLKAPDNIRIIDLPVTGETASASSPKAATGLRSKICPFFRMP